jgi:predicted nucleic acid-binding protein
MQQLERFQFTHHIGKEDCLIAAVSYRLQLPLYTHNLKDIPPAAFFYGMNQFYGEWEFCLIL